MTATATAHAIPSDDLFARVSDADADATATELVGPPVESPASRAFADAASFLGLTCEAGRAANAAADVADGKRGRKAA